MNILSTKNVIIVLLLSLFWILACGSSGDEDKSSSAEVAEERHPGQKVYNNYCITCHGYNGTMGANGAHNLKESTLSLDERIEVITNGRNTMTAFGKVISEDQIADVAQYIESLRG